jgi:hypothetical protein
MLPVAIVTHDPTSAQQFDSDLIALAGCVGAHRSDAFPVRPSPTASTDRRVLCQIEGRPACCGTDALQASPCGDGGPPGSAQLVHLDVWCSIIYWSSGPAGRPARGRRFGAGFSHDDIVAA